MWIVPPLGLEPRTHDLKGRCYYQLSYRGKVPAEGLEPSFDKNSILSAARIPQFRHAGIHCQAVAICLTTMEAIHVMNQPRD